MPQMENTFPKLTVAKVAKVLDEFTVVINKGANDGIKKGQKFLIYNLAEEIIDPDKNESLGSLEIVRGTGKVTHLQETMATLGSDMTNDLGRSVRRFKRPSLAAFFGPEEIEETIPAQTIPFNNVQVGDLVKPI